MTRRVIFKPAAEAEMEQAHAWYEQRKAGLGDEFLRCMDACIASMQRNPELYPVVHNQIRMALVKRFPYLVFYTVGSKSNHGILRISRRQSFQEGQPVHMCNWHETQRSNMSRRHHHRESPMPCNL
jgi:plasmid stabilization system protein ParE